MNKEHFLSELSRRLDGLNGNDLYRTLEYYAEMIDDRVEDGMSEEAAVAALGDLEAIAREIMQDAPARESAKREESNEADEPERQVFTGELRRIHLDSMDADFVVRGAELPEGTCCVVENAQDMLCRMEDGALTVSDSENDGGHTRFDTDSGKGRGSFRFSADSEGGMRGLLNRIFSMHTVQGQPVTVLVPEHVRCEMEIHSKSGDVQLENFALDGSVRADSFSGDLSAAHVSATGELAMKSTSGDVELSECRALRLTLKSTSGDIQLRSVESETGASAASVSGDVTVQGANLVDELTCQTASGDVRLCGANAERISVSSSSGDVSVQNTLSRTDMELSSVSGDVTVSDSEAQGALKARSTGGDVRLRSAAGASLSLESRSGDIGGTLRGPESLYDFRCHSRIGDVRAPDSRGERPVEARTSGGDIRLKVE